MNSLDNQEKQALSKQRLEVLQQLEDWVETPMLVISFAWMGLFIIDVIWGLSPLLQVISNVIWILFIIDFTIRFILAPRKLAYLRSNLLTTIALVLPALRLFRGTRFIRLLGTARAARGLQLLRVVTRANRGMRALGKSFQRRGIGYVLTLTLVVTLLGAAGMYAFENNPSGEGLNNYGTALWWTAMIMTTMGSDYWPKSAEGRVLCFFIAVYAVAVFGYVTAAIATFFIDRDADDKESEIASAKSIDALHTEISQLRGDIKALNLTSLINSKTVD
jgi:voltage-gated potassium channel